jgi:hypothetical protein
MAHHLFIVSRGFPELYEYLVERFAGDPNVKVIWDRRFGERRRRDDPCETERRSADRRTRSFVDEELASHSHAIVTV